MVTNVTTLLVKHTVEDYETWKTHFDDHASTREEYGERGYRLFRLSEDPNELVTLWEWESAESVQEFMEESDVREAMDESGVVGEPEMYFLEEIEDRTAEIRSA